MREDRERVKIMSMGDVENAGAETSDVLDDVLGDAGAVTIETGQEEGAGQPVTEAAPETIEAEQAAQNTPAREEPEPKSVPLATFLNMRDEAKAKEAEIAALQQQLAVSQKPASKPVGLPDPVEDPDGYAGYMQAIEARLEQMDRQNEETRMSAVNFNLEMAEQRFGEEFKAAYAAAQANPQVASYVLRHPNPGAALMECYRAQQRQQIAEEIPIGKSKEDWIREEYAKLQPQSGTATTQPQPQIQAPPSLVGAKGGSAPSIAQGVSDDPLDDLLK